MENCDEILIEVSRGQATFSNGNASWGIKIPPLILEEGDQIQALGSWLSVKNSGDSSIEIFDPDNPKATEINASLDLNYWKTMDSINCVSFPYHSFKWSNEFFNLGCGFGVPAYRGTGAVHVTSEPKFSFTNTSTGAQSNNVPVSLVNTYNCLKNELNADKFVSNSQTSYGTQGYESFLTFLQNTSIGFTSLKNKHPQGMIDEANSGNRFYLMSRQSNGQYIRCAKKVNMKFPVGYYTATSIASFITDELNLVYYNDIPPGGDLEEAWTPGFRYWEALYPIPVPPCNINGGLQEHNAGNATYQTINVAVTDSAGNKFSGYQQRFSNLILKQITGPGFGSNQIMTANLPFFNSESFEFNQLEFLSKSLDNFSGSREQAYGTYGGAFSGSWADINAGVNRPYGIQYNAGFHIGRMQEPITGTEIRDIYGHIFSYHQVSNTGNIVSHPAMNYPVTEGSNEVFQIILYILDIGTGTLTNNFLDQPFTIDIFWGGPDYPAGLITALGTYPQSPISLDIPPMMTLPIGFDSNQRSHNTPYNWCPIAQNRNSLDVTSKTAKYVKESGSGWKRGSDDYWFAYPAGNTVLGSTYSNFNRWNLKNDEEPPILSDNPDDPRIMPILRKYPLFMEYGMKLCVNGSVDTTQQNYMIGISSLSTVTLNSLLQKNKVLIENKTYSTHQVKLRCQLYYNFIKAQIDDGLIKEDEIVILDGIEYIPFYTHVVIETKTRQNRYGSIPEVGDFTDQFTNNLMGEQQLRNRARSLICMVKSDEFKNQGETKFDSTTNKGSFRGISYIKSGNHYYLQLDAYSWVYDKCGGIDMENYGFMDYNNSDKDNLPNNSPSTVADVINLNASKITDCITNDPNYFYRFGMGYSYRKTAWRNYTGMLCSYQEKNQNPEFLFDPAKNRVPTQFNSSFGDLTYNTRIGVGASNPSLVFDQDGSSRFYFQQLYSPQTVSNKWYAGIQNDNNNNLVTSTNFPIYTYTYTLDIDATGAGKNDKPDLISGFATKTVDNDTIQYSNNFPSNTQVSNDCVYYNQDKWDLENDGFYQGVVEMTKHYSFNWNITISNNGSGADSEDSRVISQTGAFPYQYWVDYDYHDRFFMFNQNARYNSWGNLYNSNGFTAPEEYADTTNKATSTIGSLGIVPFCFWGSNSGNQMIIKWDGTKLVADRRSTDLYPNNDEPFSQNMTICPNISAVYAEKSGCSIDTFYDQDSIPLESNTFTNSFWNILGFSFEDLLPSPYNYCNQARNFTTNLLSNSSSFLSRPLTTQANLPNNFNIVQGNRVNTIQDTTMQPSKTYISQVGITGINRAIQTVSMMTGGSFTHNDTTTYDNIVISNIQGGVSRMNQLLINNDMYILVEQSSVGSYGTKLYSTGVASKIDDAFYLVRSDFVEDNFKYVNNANNGSVLPVVSIANKQYGATTDFFYSDSEYMTFVNKRKRVVSSIQVEITDSAGNLATVLEPKSTIFFRVIRKAEGVLPEDVEALDDLDRWELDLDRKKKALLKEEIKQLISGRII